MAATILLLSTVADRSATDAVVAPNIAARAFEYAAAATVKLYGPRIGRDPGYASGVLVSPDGRILTTLSTMVTLRGVTAVLPDGREFDVEMLRTDEARQLALLKIDGAALPYLTPVSSESLDVADAVIALGNPFKIAEGSESASAHQGIVMLRTNLDAFRLAQEFDYHGPAIIVDAITANPGAPGGPLLDTRGRFVGLVGEVIEASGTKTRLNYAVPGEELLAFLSGDARADSTAAAATSMAAGAGEPYLGITMTRLGFRHVAAFVERVAKNSPADQAGIRPDDLIIAVDGRRVADASEFETAATALSPGRTTMLTIRRGEDVFNLEVFVGEKP